MFSLWVCGGAHAYGRMERPFLQHQHGWSSAVPISSNMSCVVLKTHARHVESGCRPDTADDRLRSIQPTAEGRSG